MADLSYPYHYVFVRTDLALAAQLVQASHACYEAGALFGTPNRNGSMVMCRAKSEHRIEYIIQKLQAEKIPHVVWREGDLDNQITAVATAPLRDARLATMKSAKWVKLWRQEGTPC